MLRSVTVAVICSRGAFRTPACWLFVEGSSACWLFVEGFVEGFVVGLGFVVLCVFGVDDPPAGVGLHTLARGRGVLGCVR